MQVNTISYKELERFILTCQRNLKLLHKHTDSLSSSLEKLQKKRYELELGLISRQSTEGLLSQIIRVFRKSEEWLTPLQIRKTFSESTGTRLAQSTLRVCLVTNENTLFERSGKTRSTKWKLKDVSVHVTR